MEVFYALKEKEKKKKQGTPYRVTNENKWRKYIYITRSIRQRRKL